MGQDVRIDIGSIHIDREVIEEIINTAVREIEGVRLKPPTMLGRIFSFLRKSKYYGIKLDLDMNQDLSIVIDIHIKYGDHLAKTAEKVQNHVKLSVEKAVDVKVKDINVNVQGVDRR